MKIDLTNSEVLAFIEENAKNRACDEFENYSAADNGNFDDAYADGMTDGYIYCCRYILNLLQE